MITATESIRDRRRLIQFESGRRLVRPESEPLRSRLEWIDLCPWLTRLAGGEPRQNALARSGTPGPWTHFSAKLRNARAGFLVTSSRSYDS